MRCKASAAETMEIFPNSFRLKRWSSPEAMISALAATAHASMWSDRSEPSFAGLGPFVSVKIPALHFEFSTHVFLVGRRWPKLCNYPYVNISGTAGRAAMNYSWTNVTMDTDAFESSALSAKDDEPSNGLAHADIHSAVYSKDHPQRPDALLATPAVVSRPRGSTHKPK